MPRSLPPDLDEVFLTRDLAAHGVSRGRAKRRDLDHSVRGVRAPAGASEALLERCRMFQTRLPEDSFFSGATSALLLHAPLPHRFESGDLDVTRPAPLRA